MISKSDLAELEDFFAEEDGDPRHKAFTDYFTPPAEVGEDASETPALATTAPAAASASAAAAAFEIAMKSPQTSYARGEAAHAELVFFEFTHLTARTVGIAGTFNDWQPEAAPMLPWGHGRWMNELSLPPGTYEYCLVVDGQWLPDPLASEAVPNLSGGTNSVLKVEPCA